MLALVQTQGLSSPTFDRPSSHSQLVLQTEGIEFDAGAAVGDVDAAGGGPRQVRGADEQVCPVDPQDWNPTAESEGRQSEIRQAFFHRIEKAAHEHASKLLGTADVSDALSRHCKTCLNMLKGVGCVEVHDVFLQGFFSHCF